MSGNSHAPQYPTALPTFPMDPSDSREPGHPSWQVPQPQAPPPLDPQIQEQLRRFHIDNGQSAIPRNEPGRMAQPGSGVGGQQHPQNQFGLMGQQAGPNVGGAQQQAGQLPGNGNPQQRMNDGQQGPVSPINMPYNPGTPQNQQGMHQPPHNGNQAQAMNAGQQSAMPHIQMPFNPGAAQNQPEAHRHPPSNANQAQQGMNGGQHGSMPQIHMPSHPGTTQNPQQRQQTPGNANPAQQGMNGQRDSGPLAGMPPNPGAPQTQPEARQPSGNANRAQQAMNTGQHGSGNMPQIHMPSNPGAPQNQQQRQQILSNANSAPQGMMGQQSSAPLGNVLFNPGAPQNQQQLQQAAPNGSMNQSSPLAAFPPNQGTAGQPNGQQPNVPNLAMPQVPPNMGQPTAAQGNPNSAANVPQAQRQANNVFGNQNHPDSRGSIGPMSPVSPMSGVPPPTIPSPNNATQQPNAAPGGANQVDLATAMAFLMSNHIQNQGAGQQHQPLPIPGSSGAPTQQGNTLQNRQFPRTAHADPLVQVRVNQQLRQPPLAGLNLPFYPVPLDIGAAIQQGEEDNFHNTRLTDLSQRFYEWTQLFEGLAVKQLTMEHQNLIHGCLTIFSPLEPGLINALNNDGLSIEGMYLIPSHRRLLAQHIIALNIQVFIYYPFYPGVDRNVGNALVSITDQLYSDRTSLISNRDLTLIARTAMLDVDWRRAVCRHLSAQIPPQTAANQALVQLIPVLQALYPHQNQIQWDGLRNLLQELVTLFQMLRLEKDIYAPFFPGRGSPKTDFEVARGSQVGPVFLCTFPGLTKRFWDQTQEGWFEKLLMPAVVELEGGIGYE